MRTRTLATVGATIVAVTFAFALAAPHPVPEPQREAAAPAAMTFEVTPLPYQLPALTPTQPEACGAATTVDYPDSTPDISYDDVLTTNGYIKVIATLTDQGQAFARPLPEGWQVSPIAPYRAEYLTPSVTTECAPPPAPPVEPGTPDANNCGA